MNKPNNQKVIDLTRTSIEGSYLTTKFLFVCLFVDFLTGNYHRTREVQLSESKRYKDGIRRDVPVINGSY